MRIRFDCAVGATHASEQERADVAAQRQAWFDAQPDLDPEDLVFIDESVLQRNGRSST
jgi:hypothetical protein